jgi:hypothetical protein
MAVLAFITFGASLAQAQSRSYVSAVGADANPCSRTAPCQTFAGTIAKVNQNGEIDVLDSGGFGTLTLTKSITIDAGENIASILASATTGINIVLNPALGNTDVVHTVRLRGISISGAGNNAKTGIRGINVQSTNFTDMKVILEDVVIDGFLNEGILFTANGGDLTVNNSVIRNNDGAGIKVDSSGANLVHVNVDNSSLVLNGDGILFEDNVRGAIQDSNISNNESNGVVVANVSQASVMQIQHTLISDNRLSGVVAGGNITYGTVQLSDCMITNNTTGLTINLNGLINSWGNNQLSSNGVDGVFSTPTLTLQ